MRTDIPKFHSIKFISNILIVSIILSISISGISIVSTAMEINFLESSDEWIDFDNDEMDANDNRVLIIASIYVVISFSSMILFFLWFYKAYKNLPVLGGKELLFSARWVILRFFIPILWFYQPYQATKEIWKSSDPTIQETDKASRKSMITPDFIKVWWALWIISSMAGWLYLSFTSSMITMYDVDGFIILDYIDIFTEIPIIISSMLTLFLVKKISFNQEIKGNSLN